MLQSLGSRVGNRLIHRVVAVLLLFVLATSPVIGQQLPVRMKLNPLLARGRTGGPLPLQIKLEYNSPQIREGDLVLEIYNSIVSPGDRMATLRYEGIVLQGGDYIFNTILPPIEPSATKLYQIVGWFETADERISLTSDAKFVDPPEPHDLLTINGFERVNTIASYSGESGRGEARGGRATLNNALRLDRFNRTDVSNARDRRYGMAQPLKMQSSVANLNALDLPEDPLHLCSFDVVILADRALSLLSETQMQSLMTWLRAGGSLCFADDDNRLKPRHLTFLQALFERADDPGFQLQLQDDGSLLVVADQNDPVCVRYVELGRVAFVPNLKDADLSLEQLRHVACHLWKVRKDSNLWKENSWKPDSPQKLLLANGVKVTPDGNGAFRLEMMSGAARQYSSDTTVNDLEEALETYGCAPTLFAKSNRLSGAAETALLPEDIRIVPASLIALLLLGYVLAIGPGDYLVLGYFGIRKYTWVLFPIVTVLFTVLTVIVANRYMASSENGSLLTVTDIDQQGQPLRSSAIQMKFMPSQSTRDESLSSSLVVPAQVATNYDPRMQGIQQRPINPYLAYSGRFPGSFTMTQSLRQWEPQVTRTLSFKPDSTALPNLDLANVDLNDPSIVTTAEGRQKLKTALSAIKDWQVEAVVLHKDQVIPVQAGELLNLTTLNRNTNAVAERYVRYNYERPDSKVVLASGLLAATRMEPENYFDIVSQVSPQGAAQLEDLPLLDSSDSQQYVLMIALYNDTENHVFRRLLYAENADD